MKKKELNQFFILSMIVLFNLGVSMAQVGIGTLSPETSSVLDVHSQSKGFLPPRMTKSERDAINGGVFAEGLVVYNTDENCINFYNGTVWISLCNLGGSTTPPDLPENITLTGGQTAYIASVYDKNYSPYITPTAAATTGRLDADGDEENLVDIQGVLNTTTGLTVLIPYSVSTGSVDLVAYSQTKTVISDHIQGANSASNDNGGAPVDVIFSYDAQTGLTGTGNIIATIKAVDNNLNAVKLDINSGIGTDLGLLLAEFSFALDENGTLGSVQLKDIPGIPDRMYGQASADGDINEHDFLYLPVQAEDGNVWLNHNLGANYSNTRNGDFNVTAIPSGVTDYNAAGSLFQWGRKPDGHELVNRTATSATHVNGATQGWLDPYTGVSSKYFYSPNRYTNLQWTWMNAPSLFNLWQPGSQINNPCPEGFKVPSRSDFDNLINSHGYTTSPANAFQKILKFVFTGQTHHDTDNSIEATAFRGQYYTHSRDGSSRFVSTFRVQNHFDPTNNIVTAGGIENEAAMAIRCIQHVEEPSTIPVGMTINTDNKVSYIASIYDEDYLPYTVPTGPANTTEFSPNTSTIEQTVDIQGTLTTTGVTVSLPYSIIGSVNYDAYDYNVVVPASLTEDQISRTINFHYDGVNGASGSGNITLTIKSVGGDLNLKKLDINRGLGNGTATEGNINSNAFGILIAEAPFYVDNSQTTKYIQLRDVSGIPDKMFGQASADGGINEHDFLYIPVEGEDNQIWLNNNLGASYADIHSSSFNIAQQMKTTNDKAAKGSLFQWGRKPDGHELTNRTITQEVTIHSYTFQRNNNPNHSLVIKATNNPYDWRTSTDNNLWNGVNSPNNPCPEGFRVPTSSELSGYFSNAGIIDSTTNKVSALKFPYAGFAVDGYSSSTISSNGGTVGYYWSTNYGTDFGQSTPEPRAYCWQFVPNSNWKRIFLERKGYSMSVRCILD